MNKDRVEGKSKEAVGSTRQRAGQVTGNKEMEGKGASQKTEGKVQNAGGKIKDKASDLKNKVTGH